MLHAGKGVQVGIVKKNKDDQKMHRVLVEFPVLSSSRKTESYWCRIITPMAGKDRGLVMIPDIGTEVVVVFSAKTSSPYIIGAVYNGKDDKPDNYANEDRKNNLRVFWSRNDHLIIFDDTKGAEKVEFGAQASSTRDVTSAPIYISLDSSKKTVTEYCDGSTSWEAENTISFKCTDFTLEASNSVEMVSGSDTAAKSGNKTDLKAGGELVQKGTKAKFNCGVVASPLSPPQFPAHNHPPSKAGLSVPSVPPSEEASPTEEEAEPTPIEEEAETPDESDQPPVS